MTDAWRRRVSAVSGALTAGRSRKDVEASNSRARRALGRARSGMTEVDLVSHSGSNGSGEFVNARKTTLNRSYSPNAPTFTTSPFASGKICFVFKPFSHRARDADCSVFSILFFAKRIFSRHIRRIAVALLKRLKNTLDYRELFSISPTDKRSAEVAVRF
ncbi:MAG: hypothetical protein KGJ84_16710 [Elusimicrobia bacterium]|nr:hypothetical protein [Elusimicrobiota bacterium]